MDQLLAKRVVSGLREAGINFMTYLPERRLSQLFILFLPGGQPEVNIPGLYRILSAPKWRSGAGLRTSVSTWGYRKLTGTWSFGESRGSRWLWLKSKFLLCGLQGEGSGEQKH